MRPLKRSTSMTLSLCKLIVSGVGDGYRKQTHTQLGNPQGPSLCFLHPRWCTHLPVPHFQSPRWRATGWTLKRLPLHPSPFGPVTNVDGSRVFRGDRSHSGEWQWVWEFSDKRAKCGTSFKSFYLGLFVSPCIVLNPWNTHQGDLNVIETELKCIGVGCAYNKRPFLGLEVYREHAEGQSLGQPCAFLSIFLYNNWTGSRSPKRDAAPRSPRGSISVQAV